MRAAPTPQRGANPPEKPSLILAAPTLSHGRGGRPPLPEHRYNFCEAVSDAWRKGVVNGKTKAPQAVRKRLGMVSAGGKLET